MAAHFEGYAERASLAQQHATATAHVFALRGTFASAAEAPPAAEEARIEVLLDTLVIVQDGLIAEVVQGKQAADAREAALTGVEITRLAPTELVLPGFVDLHCHPAQATFAGTGTDRPLLGPEGWLEKYTYPAERSWADTTLAARVANEVVERGLRHGITTAVYFATIHREGTLALVDACLSRGQRAVVGKVAMDRCAPADYVETTEESVSESELFIQATLEMAKAHPSSAHAGGPLVRPAITPRFVPTCSPALLAGLGALAQKYEADGVLVQSHIAQSRDQVAFTEKLHPDAALFDAAGLLTPRCVMAHAIHLEQAELDLFAQRRASLAFCPLSNVFHTELPASTLDAPRALKRGVNVGLACDFAGGYSPSMLCACRSAVLASRCCANVGGGGGKPVDWRHALWLATRGGAAALGANVGGFEVGREFDAQLFDVAAGDVTLLHPGFAPPADESEVLARVERFINLGDDRCVKRVWVRGRLVKGVTSASSS